MSLAPSYRDFVNTSAAYHARLRDREIENKGILVRVRRRFRSTTTEYGDSEPKIGRLGEDAAGVPELSDPVLDPIITEELWCLPYYEVERWRVNEAGVSVEDGDVLEVAFKTTDFVPKDAEIDFPAINLSDVRDQKTWIVAGAKVKHVEEIYENVVRCVPKRKRFAAEYAPTPDFAGPDGAADVLARSAEREVLAVDDRLLDYGDLADDDAADAPAAGE